MTPPPSYDEGTSPAKLGRQAIEINRTDRDKAPTVFAVAGVPRPACRHEGIQCRRKTAAAIARRRSPSRIRRRSLFPPHRLPRPTPTPPRPWLPSASKLLRDNLAQGHDDRVRAVVDTQREARLAQRDGLRLTVQLSGDHAPADTVGISDRNVVDRATITQSHLEAGPCGRDARID